MGTRLLTSEFTFLLFDFDDIPRRPRADVERHAKWRSTHISSLERVFHAHPVIEMTTGIYEVQVYNVDSVWKGWEDIKRGALEENGYRLSRFIRNV